MKGGRRARSDKPTGAGITEKVCSMHSKDNRRATAASGAWYYSNGSRLHGNDDRGTVTFSHTHGQGTVTNAGSRRAVKLGLAPSLVAPRQTADRGTRYRVDRHGLYGTTYSYCCSIRVCTAVVGDIRAALTTPAPPCLPAPAARVPSLIRLRATLRRSSKGVAEAGWPRGTPSFEACSLLCPRCGGPLFFCFLLITRHWVFFCER